MKRLIIVSALSSVALLSAACRDSAPMFTPADLGKVSDGSTSGGKDGGTIGPDMAVVTYTEATPHDIDTNPATFPRNTAVKLTGMIVTTPVTSFISKVTQCKYELWLQDPACTTPPCGLVVTMNGPMLPTQDGSAKDCPAAAQSGNDLATLAIGDKIDVQGIVDTFKPNGSNVTQHEIDASKVTKTGTGTAMVFDVTDGSIFVNNTGSGWAMYEGTLVKLKPTAGLLTIADTFPGNKPVFTVTPGNAYFAFTFLFDSWVGNDAGPTKVNPEKGTTWTSITGVVTALFSGQILPRSMNDFEPPAT